MAVPVQSKAPSSPPQPALTLGKATRGPCLTALSGSSRETLVWVRHRMSFVCVTILKLYTCLFAEILRGIVYVQFCLWENNKTTFISKIMPFLFFQIYHVFHFEFLHHAQKLEITAQNRFISCNNLKIWSTESGNEDTQLRSDLM